MGHVRDDVAGTKGAAAVLGEVTRGVLGVGDDADDVEADRVLLRAAELDQELVGRTTVQGDLVRRVVSVGGGVVGAAPGRRALPLP